MNLAAALNLDPPEGFRARFAKAEVMAQSPSLADKVARSTTESTLEEIASEIARVVAAATGPASSSEEGRS